MLPWSRRRYERVVIDTETTGLDLEVDELLQVAVTDGDGHLLHNAHYKPVSIARWPEAQAINGISPESVARCKHARADRRKLQRLINRADQVCVYNAAFDTAFLARIGVDLAHANLHDTMIDYAELHGERDERIDEYKWQRLVYAAEQTGYEGAGSAHDALEDCKMTAIVQQWCDKQRRA